MNSDARLRRTAGFIGRRMAGIPPRRDEKTFATVCGLAFATRTGWIPPNRRVGSRRATQNQNCVFIGDKCDIGDGIF